MSSAGENWAEDQDPTGELYASLSLYAEYVPVRWDTVTLGSSFQAYEDMLRSVAVDYLLNGDVECYCER